MAETFYDSEEDRKVVMSFAIPLITIGLLSIVMTVCCVLWCVYAPLIKETYYYARDQMIALFYRPPVVQAQAVQEEGEDAFIFSMNERNTSMNERSSNTNERTNISTRLSRNYNATSSS
ncbi:uncharacterized protein [Macrobrachium rosenbergii]|uniref:uncharacterized protein n=1 Tax=Macrobrachium rosenbergii TaxID=79674 RepID=UPI0034D3A5A6